jgi:hypothetical protein
MGGCDQHVRHDCSASDERNAASGPTPFVTGCDGELPSGTVYANARSSHGPINPLDRNHWIGTGNRTAGRTAARGPDRGPPDAGLTRSRRFVPFSRYAGGNAANGGDMRGRPIRG